MKNKERKGLCFRCEYRAEFLETGRKPRYECGDIESCKFGCYMYKPVKPCVLAPDKNDDRPQFGPALISSRSYHVDVEPPVVLDLGGVEGGSFLYWRPIKDGEAVGE